MPLTDSRVRAARASEKLYKMADGGSLYLYVRPSGSKSWVVEYRYAGKPKTYSIGQYPAVSLADARDGRDLAKKLLAKGKDPSLEKQMAKKALETAGRNTFGILAEEYIQQAQQRGRAEATLKKNRWMLLTVASTFSNRPIGEITAPEILTLLTNVEREGKYDTAVATRAAIGRVFRYAIRNGLVTGDPTPALSGALQPPKPKGHAGLTDPTKIGGLMRAIYGFEGWYSLKGAMQVQALCFARPGETLRMVWSEVDLEQRIWSIPGARTKSRRDHEVPLSRQTVDVLQNMASAYGQKDQVFPSMMSGKRFLSAASINSALRRMGYSNDEQTAHGFRKTAATILNESGEFRLDAIEEEMAHLDPDKVRRTYNKAGYWSERVKMMQWWADFLDGVRMDGEKSQKSE